MSGSGMVEPVEVGQSNYTHEVCGLCGALLYCSEAEPWNPQAEYGWCEHGDEPEAVWTRRPDGSCWHRCPANETEVR